METTVFLALNRRGVVKATKGKTSLARDEIGVMVRLSVPDSVFRAPLIEAVLSVPDYAVIVPELQCEVIAEDEPTQETIK